EWQRAWRACYAADERLMAIYAAEFSAFERTCSFVENGKQIGKMIACLKHALKVDGVIDSDRVATGTPDLTAEQKSAFASQYRKIQDNLQRDTNEGWLPQ